MLWAAQNCINVIVFAAQPKPPPKCHCLVGNEIIFLHSTSFACLLAHWLIPSGRRGYKVPEHGNPGRNLRDPGTRTSPGLRLRRGVLGMETGGSLLGVSCFPGGRDANHGLD